MRRTRQHRQSGRSGHLTPAFRAAALSATPILALGLLLPRAQVMVALRPRLGGLVAVGAARLDGRRVGVLGADISADSMQAYLGQVMGKPLLALLGPRPVILISGVVLGRTLERLRASAGVSGFGAGLAVAAGGLGTMAPGRRAGRGAGAANVPRSRRPDLDPMVART